MKTLTDLHNYQKKAIDLILQKKRCALFFKMGAGKTVISLTAFSKFLQNLECSNVLIIAPLRVANSVWETEARQWDHLKNLRFEICTGDETQRLRALKSDADFHVINREQLPWLVKKTNWKWDAVIVDESSSFKNPSSERFKALRSVVNKIDKIVLLSGTPSPNSYLDLWSQLYLIDKGARLGRSMGIYKNQYFYKSGFKGKIWTIRSGAQKQINKKIADVCFTVNNDEAKSPDFVLKNIIVDLSTETLLKYEEIKKEFLLSLEDEKNIFVKTAAVLANKLLQLCNGGIYDDEKKFHYFSNEKIIALKKLSDENPKENFFVFYNFKSDLSNLKNAFPHAKELDEKGKVLEEWNAGKVKMILAHPASCGHGLNAQFGGSHVVWYGLTWSLELYQQANARLLRQGQKNIVKIYHLVAKNCIDQKVLSVLDKKELSQKQLLDFLRLNI